MSLASRLRAARYSALGGGRCERRAPASELNGPAGLQPSPLRADGGQLAHHIHEERAERSELAAVQGAPAIEEKRARQDSNLRPAA